MSHPRPSASRLRGEAFAARFALILFLACVHQALLNTAYAETFCAEHAAELQTALDTADSNGVSDSIQIRTGVHSSALVLRYSAHSTEDFDLTVSGGWSDNCVFAESQDPFDTQLINTGAAGSTFHFRSYAGDLHIENVAFTNAAESPFSALDILVQSDPRKANVSIERVAFSGNASRRSASISGGVTELRIRSSLFFNNQPDAATISIRPNKDGAMEVYFINNTVVSNTSAAGATGTGGLFFGGTTPVDSLFVNNIFWDNSGVDLDLRNPGQIFLQNNNIEDQVGVADVDANNLSVDPMFGLSYAPEFDSPMVDAGMEPFNIVPFPVPFQHDWSLGALDINGSAREQGSTVDIGAVEVTAEIIFSDGYE